MATTAADASAVKVDFRVDSPSDETSSSSSEGSPKLRRVKKVFGGVHEIVWILLGAVLGVIIGVVLSLGGASPEWGIWLGMFGTLYIRALTLLVVPIVFTSVVCGVASLQNLGLSTGTIGWKTVGLYLLTTLVAIIEGLAITYALMPIWDKNSATGLEVVVEPSSVSYDAMASVHLTNEEYFNGWYNTTTASYAVLRLPGAEENTTITDLLYLYNQTVTFTMPAAVDSTGPLLGDVAGIEVYAADDSLAFMTPSGSLTVTLPDSSSSDGGISESFQGLLYSIVPNNIIGIFYGCVEGGCTPDLLSMIVFAIAFSIGMMIIKTRGSHPDVLLPLFTETLEIVLMLVLVVIKGTPIAVCSLILSAIAANPLDQLVESMSSLGVLVAGLIFAFVFHILVTMSFLSWAFTRTNPYKHIAGMGKAMTLSFGCASSAATLPTNIICCENMGFNPAIVRFVLSLGATVSMDGTAIYIPSVIIWLAAQAGMYMNAGQIAVLAIIATLASAGASPTPGLIAIVILCWGSVFPGVPIPPEIAYLAAVDWLIDRCVTTTNITGDSFVTRIMDHLVGMTTMSETDNMEEYTKQLEQNVTSMDRVSHMLEGDEEEHHAKHKHHTKSKQNPSHSEEDDPMQGGMKV